MIRKAIQPDVKLLFELEKEVFEKDSFSLSKTSLNYHVKNSVVYVIEIDKKIVGYILWLKRKHYFRLYSLAILKSFQNQGLAKELLKYSFEKLQEKSFSLEVKISNIGAIKLYKKFGFVIKKVLKNYYESEDGYLMIKQ